LQGAFRALQPQQSVHLILGRQDLEARLQQLDKEGLEMEQVQTPPNA
jgi:hypothetical protein